MAAKRAEKYIDENGMRWWAAGDLQREHGVSRGTAEMWCRNEGSQIGASKRVSGEWLSAKLATRREDGSFSSNTQDSKAKISETLRAKPHYDGNGMRWWSLGEIEREHAVSQSTAIKWCRQKGEKIDGARRLPDSWIQAKLATRMPDGSFSTSDALRTKLDEQQLATIARLSLMGAAWGEIGEVAGAAKTTAGKMPNRPDVQAAIAAMMQDAERYGWRTDQEDKKIYGITPKWLRTNGKAKPTSLTAKRNLNGITLISSSGIHRELRQQRAA